MDNYYKIKQSVIRILSYRFSITGNVLECFMTNVNGTLWYFFKGGECVLETFERESDAARH